MIKRASDQEGQREREGQTDRQGHEHVYVF